jgi:hypothetical protein
LRHSSFHSSSPSAAIRNGKHKLLHCRILIKESSVPSGISGGFIFHFDCTVHRARPTPSWNRFEPKTKCMKPSVTIVAKHHFFLNTLLLDSRKWGKDEAYLVIGIIAFCTHFAIHALPSVSADNLNHVVI